MNTAYFIIGASGSGKSTALSALKPFLENQCYLLHFDSIGVPTFEVMKKECGSLENWQREKIIEWVEKLKTNYLMKRTVIFDGQINPQFIQKACEKFEVNYQIILLDCTDLTRIKRLEERNQKDLATKDMMNWAKFLRNECQLAGYPLIDTTKQTVTQTTECLLEFLSLYKS